MAVQPLINQLGVNYTGHTTSTFLAGATGMIDEFKDEMVSLGWTVTDEFKAFNVTDYPLGAPVRSSAGDGSGSTHPLCVGGTPIFTVLGVPIFRYDPTVCDPPGPNWAPLGHTVAETVGSIAAAISATTLGFFTATPSFNSVLGFWQIFVECTFAGGQFNYLQASADGEWGVNNGYIDGGGWELTSPLADYAWPSATVPMMQWKVQVRAKGKFNPVSEHLTTPILYDMFVPASSKVSVQASMDPAGKLFANQYGFALVFGATELMAFSLAVDPLSGIEIPATPETAPWFAVLPGSRQLSGTLCWENHVCAVIRGGSAPNVFDSPLGGAFPRILTYRSNGQGPATPDGHPLFHRAFVQFGGVGEGSPAFVQGELLDCAVTTGVTTGMTIPSDDHKHSKLFEAIAFSDGSNGTDQVTLLMDTLNT